MLRAGDVAAPRAEDASTQRAETGEKAQLLEAGSYQAGSWQQERRLVIKLGAGSSSAGGRFPFTWPAAILARSSGSSHGENGTSDRLRNGS
jgi:hypothetical protein